MELIKFRDVSFSYSGKDILTGVNLDINTGDYIYVVGENGSGKTTLIKGLLGLKKPNKGEIIFEASLGRNEVGYIPQQKDIKRDFPASVWEIVLSGRLNNKGKSLFYTRKDKAIANRNMEKLDILALKNKPYKFLSGGQQQRVLLARALCATGKLLILDEPDTGLDPEAKKDLYLILEDLNKNDGITIIMVTHDIKEELLEKENKVFYVNQGRVDILSKIGDRND